MLKIIDSESNGFVAKVALDGTLCYGEACVSMFEL